LHPIEPADYTGSYTSRIYHFIQARSVLFLHYLEEELEDLFTYLESRSPIVSLVCSSCSWAISCLCVANQTVVQAEAQARANIAKANGESQAIKIINEQLRQNPQYLQWQGINRWNGQLPYSLGAGGGVPFFQLPGPIQQQEQNQTR
jgi:hypothetical protein